MGSRPVRRLDQPRPLVVVAGPTGVPHAVGIDGRRRLVMAIRDEWLVQDRWWTDEPVDRHYFELLIEPGRVIVVFHDMRGGDWRTHAPAQAPADRDMRHPGRLPAPDATGVPAFGKPSLPK